MTRHARRGTKYQTDEPNHPASRGTMRRWVIGMLFAVIALLHLAGTPAAPADQWVSLGPAGTQVAAIAIDPTTPTTIYAGGYCDCAEFAFIGFSKSTDGGATWQAGGVSTPRPTAPAQRPLWLRPEWAFAILRACGKAPPPRHDMCRHRTVSTTSSGPDRAERASKPPRGVPVAKRAC